MWHSDDAQKSYKEEWFKCFMLKLSMCQLFTVWVDVFVKLTSTCAYQGVRTVRFLENLACFVFLKQPFWDSSFCLITDDFWLIRSPGKRLPLMKTCPQVNIYCVKSVQIQSFFWSVISRIQSECGKIRTRNNSVFGHFSRRDLLLDALSYNHLKS